MSKLGLKQQRVVAARSVLGSNFPLKQVPLETSEARGGCHGTNKEKLKTHNETRACATWILRVEADHHTCKRAEVRRLGAKEAGTVRRDKEDARQGVRQRKHAIRHNENTLWRHQEHVGNGCDPEER